MTIEEFIDKIKELKIYLLKSKRDPYYTSDINETCYLYKEWTIGGMTGGNCWGNKPYPIDCEEEPEFTSLDKLLFEVCPNIGFMQYKMLLQSIETCEREDLEYYGNYTKIKLKVIKIEDLYNKLKEMELI